MNGLMFKCVNWGGMDCHPDVSVHKRQIKQKNREDTFYRPAVDEQQKLDDICKACELRFFEIEQRECSVCGNREFTETTGLEIDEEGAKKFENLYLKCDRCGSPAILLKSN